MYRAKSSASPVTLRKDEYSPVDDLLRGGNPLSMVSRPTNKSSNTSEKIVDLSGDGKLGLMLGQLLLTDQDLRSCKESPDEHQTPD
jgi:hypothetical protein